MTDLIVFSENVLGGIQSYYSNLLTHIDKSKFNINWLLINHKHEARALPPEYRITSSKIDYNDSLGRWRKAKQISKYIPNEEGLIIANREFELDSLYLYPKPNRYIVYVVHDDYYLQFALKYECIISAYIAHNSFIYKELANILPENREKDVYFLPYGIRLSPWQRTENHKNKLTIAFVARLDILKGIHDLRKIDLILKENFTEVNWLIIGDGPEKGNFLKSVNKLNNFEYFRAKDDIEIFNKLKECDIYILPSLRDGTPVSLLESMSVGLVPIIYEFNSGIKDIVNKDNGYVVNSGDYKKMTEIILRLNTNRNELEIKSQNTLSYSKNNFDINKRVKDYENFFSNYRFLNKKIYSSPKMESIFESPLMPEIFYKVIRKIKKVVSYKNI